MPNTIPCAAVVKIDKATGEMYRKTIRIVYHYLARLTMQVFRKKSLAHLRGGVVWCSGLSQGFDPSQNKKLNKAKNKTKIEKIKKAKNKTKYSNKKHNIKTKGITKNAKNKT